MKKICCLVLVFSFIFFIGCNNCTIKNKDLNIIEKLPAMSKENQKYYNKYLKIFDYRSPFRYSFSENNFDYFPTEYIYSTLNKTKICVHIDSNNIDEYLKNYFPISYEQLHSLSVSYKKEKGKDFESSYMLPVVCSDSSFVGIVTDNQKKDNTLILSCDWYQMISDNPIKYKKWSKSVTTIELNDDNWFYASNDSNRIYKDNDIPESIKIDENGLPKMTADHQNYYDKYIGFFKGHVNPFHHNFSKNNFEFFNASFIYPYLAVNADKDKIEKLKSCKKLSQDIVEDIILKYFPMTKEYCRESTGLSKNIGYHQDKKYYDIAPLHLNKYNNRGTINKVEIEDNIFKLHCDWYSTGINLDVKNPNGIKEIYSYWGSSILSIKVNDDSSWKYISNKVTNQTNNNN